VRIGALTTHAEIASSQALKEASPVLGEEAAMIGDPQVRNRGTIGGNVAHADPASDLPTVLTALDASFNVTGPSGDRTVSAADFFQGIFATALDEKDVLTSVAVPTAQGGQGMSYSKFSHPASRYAVVGAAAVVTISGGTCSAASVSVGGLVPRPVRVAAVESALVGKNLTDDVVSAAARAVSDDLGDDIIGDIYASAEYRGSMASVYVGRALRAAVAQGA
jgi:carbon-monoxide dehydrogenase medium subunit